MPKRSGNTNVNELLSAGRGDKAVRYSLLDASAAPLAKGPKDMKVDLL